jgi:hypothetical protein
MMRLFYTVAAVFLTLLALPHNADAAPSSYYDTVQRVYIGYYQRPADPGGLVYWAQRLDRTNGDLNQIIEAYANSPESQALYGTISSSNIGEVVDSIYMGLFGRSAEPEGRAYYVDGFKSGDFTAATIMLNVLYGAQNQDLQSINNKLAAANLFTRTLDPNLDGKNLQYTYAGNNDAAAGRSFLSTYATSVRAATASETTAYVKAYIADLSEPPAVIPLKTSILAPSLPGDAWVDTFTGTINNGSTNISVTGTTTSQILSATKKSPITGEDCLDSYESITLTAGSSTLTDTGHTYFSYDSEGSLLHYGDQGGVGADVWVVSPETGFYLRIPSPVYIGQSLASSATFSDGTSLNYNYTVLATEGVLIGIGIYEAYRVLMTTTVHFPTGTIDRQVATGTRWLVPGLGHYVKSIIDLTNYSGSTPVSGSSRTTVLSNTNVNY